MRTLNELVAKYKTQNSYDTQTEYIGCGGEGLITFYKAIGVETPVVDDLSENLILAYVGHVRKNLHPAMAELCLLDFKSMLEAVYKWGDSETNLSQLISPDTSKTAQNDFSAYAQKWKC